MTVSNYLNEKSVGLYILWPQRKIVTPEWVMDYAATAFKNGEKIPNLPSDLEEAVYLLGNASMITVDHYVY